MKDLKQYINEKLVITKDYNVLDGKDLIRFIERNVDFNYAYHMMNMTKKSFSDRLYNRFKGLWRIEEMSYIKSKDINEKIQKLLIEFDKYDTVWKFSVSNNEQDKKAGTYYLFDNINKIGFDIVDLNENKDKDICIRYSLYENDIIILKFGRYGQQSYEFYEIFIAYKN